MSEHRRAVTVLFDRSSQTHFIILIPLSTLLDGNIEEMWLKKKGNLTCLKIEVFYILLTKTFFFVFPSYKPLFKLREVRTNMDVKTGKKNLYSRVLQLLSIL